MAKDNKNKENKKLITKVSNHKKIMKQEERELAGSISIAISATAFSNSFTICPNGSFIIPCPNGYIILAFALLFFLYGFWITPSKKRILWSRIEILVGVSFFFIGLRIASSNLSILITGRCMGWTITIGAIILIFIGIYLWHKAKVENKNNEQKQGES
jgi:putative Mn2+ efflux pump MntP